MYEIFSWHFHKRFASSFQCPPRHLHTRAIYTFCPECSFFSDDTKKIIFTKLSKCILHIYWMCQHKCGKFPMICFFPFCFSLTSTCYRVLGHQKKERSPKTLLKLGTFDDSGLLQNRKKSFRNHRCTCTSQLLICIAHTPRWWAFGLLISVWCNCNVKKTPPCSSLCYHTACFGHLEEAGEPRESPRKTHKEKHLPM